MLVIIRFINSINLFQPALMALPIPSSATCLRRKLTSCVRASTPGLIVPISQRLQKDSIATSTVRVVASEIVSASLI